MAGQWGPLEGFGGDREAPGGDEHRSGRRRSRARIAVAALTVAALLAVGLGVALRFGRDHPWNRAGRAEAARVADGFFATMSSGDVERLNGLVNDAAAGEDLVTSFRDRLSIASARYTHGPVVRAGSGATVGYRADVVLTGLGRWRFSGTEALVRDHRHWRVRVVPELIYPGRHAGTRLERDSTPGKPGRIVDRHGAPLANDQDLTANVLGASAGVGLNRAASPRLTPGAAGGRVVLVDEATNRRTVLASFDPGSGGDVRTTFDLGVQHAGEAALGTLSASTEAGLVAVDTSTGGVLAAVSHPPSGTPVAIGRAFPPGSTFKIVTATALLANGVRAGTPVTCAPSVVVGKQTFHNAEGHPSGRMTLAEAFAQSCNTAFIALASRLPGNTLAQVARTYYGFTPSQPLPVASIGGTIRDPASAAESAENAIGQGSVEASPLQMASVAAAVASGVWRQPFIIDGPAQSHRLPAGVAATLRAFMRETVIRGTAAAVAFPGEVYGKTGTAEHGSGSPPPAYAWFVGFRGSVAFAVFVDHGTGADTAAPRAAAFLRSLG